MDNFEQMVAETMMMSSESQPTQLVAHNKGWRAGLRALRVICASLGFAFALDVMVCLLPENDYQRWQSVNGAGFGNLRWAYERIHFDSRPVDIAIVGSSKTLLGLCAERIEQRLSIRERPANVTNFSVIGSGRNVQWALVDELYKAKSPKVIVIGVDGTTDPYGHAAFKYVAPAAAIINTPAPLLHDYLGDLAYLPARKMKLFGAWLFPDLFGLRKKFDPEIYARTRIDFTSGTWSSEGKLIDMERVVPPATLLAQANDDNHPTLLSRILTLCCNDGDDRVYIREIAKEAKAHGTQLMFVYFPNFNGDEQSRDLTFLKNYGTVVNNGDLSRRSELFENWTHLNHAGATIASDRVANALADLKLSNLN